MGFLFGLLLGFVSAVPVGPICILAVTQRIRRGFYRGYSGVLAASVMDIIYSLVAVEAASFVTHIIHRYSEVMKIGGTLILAVVSIGLFRQSRTFQACDLDATKSEKDVHPALTTLLLYVSGPTIPAFWLMAGGLAVAHGWVERGHPSAFIFAAATGIGSALWYFILLKILLRSADKLTAGLFRTVFFILGSVLVILAVLNLLSIWVVLPGKVRLG